MGDLGSLTNEKTMGENRARVDTCIPGEGAQ